jgi:MerR family transcriptional regulator, light-induced transcriptional regulator
MIRTTAAASILGVSTNTLRSWERRYGFPQPKRSEGGHRQYELDEIEALRQTLAETHNISSAIALVQERGAGPVSSARVAAAYVSFDAEQADRLLEESMIVRSLERTIDEVLIPAVTECADPGGPTAEYEFAWRHGIDWLAAIGRLTPPPKRHETVLLFEATIPCDLDAVYIRALAVLLGRAGLRTLSLTPAIDRSRLGRALRALNPDAVVVCGRRSSLDTLGRLIYTVRSMNRHTLVFDYRRAVADTRGSAISSLPDGPLHACDSLVSALDGGSGSVASLR